MLRDLPGATIASVLPSGEPKTASCDQFLQETTVSGELEPSDRRVVPHSPPLVSVAGADPNGGNGAVGTGPLPPISLSSCFMEAAT